MRLSQVEYDLYVDGPDVVLELEDVVLRMTGFEAEQLAVRFTELSTRVDSGESDDEAVSYDEALEDGYYIDSGDDLASVLSSSMFDEDEG